MYNPFSVCCFAGFVQCFLVCVTTGEDFFMLVAGNIVCCVFA